MTDQADQFLVEQIRQGKEQSWQQLIDRYQGRLKVFARSRLASQADVDDLVQDTFIGFLQSLHRYDSNRSLETFLFTILRYKIIDFFRAQSSATQALMTEPDEWWEEVTPLPGESPSGHAMHFESVAAQERILTEALRSLINTLKARGSFEDLQIIELLFYGGRKNKQVAKLMDKDEKQIAGVKYRAIQRIQNCIDHAEAGLLDCLDELHAEATVCQVWRAGRITCLKRATLGRFLLGALEEPWNEYTQFHLDVVGCPLCLANLEDIKAEDEEHSPHVDTQRIFASSVGFLSRPSAT